MSETLIIILNIATMLSILLFAGYLSSVLGDNKLGIGCIVRMLLKDKAAQEHIRRKRIYLWCFLLIPILLGIDLVLISQMRIGKMYIRVDFTFLANFILWICIPLFVRSMYNKIKRLEDNQKQKDNDTHI